MESTTSERRIGRVAWVMAWVGLVVGQFHAMARHNTVDGQEDLESWTTRVWSDPARRLLRSPAGLGEPGRGLPDLRQDLVPGLRRLHRLRVRASTDGGSRPASRGGPGGSRCSPTSGRASACLRRLLDPVDPTPHGLLDAAFLALDVPGAADVLGRLDRPRDHPAAAWLPAAGLRLAAGADGPARRSSSRCSPRWAAARCRRCSPSGSSGGSSPAVASPRTGTSYDLVARAATSYDVPAGARRFDPLRRGQVGTRTSEGGWA